MAIVENPSWQGVYPAITTQFHEDQSLNLPATSNHIEALVESGISGLIVCGSLGENQTMQPEEKRAVVKNALEVVRGRIPVVSGLAETSTRSALQYVRDCESLGVSGFMVMPPMVYKPSESETFHWFRTIARSMKSTWMLYNNPVGYYTDVTPSMFEKLSDIPNLLAIKESSANTRRVTELRNCVGDRYKIFTGVDDLMLESAILGIDGWVAGSGIAFPKENQLLWDLTRQQKWNEALDLYRWSQPLMKLDTHVHFVQYIKLLLQEVGLGKEWVREPRLPIAGIERDEVLHIIRTSLKKRP